MSYLMPRRRRPVAAATLALVCLLVAAAPQAWADGEDDPTFGNAGTSFLALGEFAPIGDRDGGPMRPRTDQGPDGAVISAVPLQADPLFARSIADVIRVVRMDAAGTPAGFDGDGQVDLDYSIIDRLLDIEVLGDGRIIIVTQSASSAGRGGTRPVEIRTLDASGNEVGDGAEFFSPEDCGNNGEAKAADVDASGKVFVGWDSCSEGAVLARYDGENDLTRTMPVENVTELLLGPDSLVYVLSNDPGIAKRGIFGASVVTRYETSNLELDDEYGDGGRGEIAQTFPIDFTVGPNGSAVVWAQPFGFAQGRGNGPEPWDFYRLGDDGELDPSWSGDGHAEINHPELGSEFTGQCNTRGRFCGSEVPQVIAQGDDKIVAIGYPAQEEQQQEPTPVRGSEAPPQETDRKIIRLTQNGALDASWDGDGVRSFTLGQPPEGAANYIAVGPPALQSDGKLLIPLFTEAGPVRNRVPAPPDGVALGVSRIGLTPAGTPVVQQQAASVAAAVAKRSCVSRRVFRIRLRTGRRKAERSAIKTVSVTVNGKKVPVTKGARRRAQVDLRNLPKGRFTVVIRMTLADGGKVRDTRRYRTCTPKQARELPGLRTRKPRR